VFNRQRLRCTNATMTISSASTPQQSGEGRNRFGVTPLVEIGVLATAIAMALISYFVIAGNTSAASQRLLTPLLVALLLGANLIPQIALIVLIGRRMAKARAGAGGDGRLHVRLVAIFSVLASVPMLLVTIFASLLFQYGIEFWFSERAHSMLENASLLAKENLQNELDRVQRETVTMSGDLRYYLENWGRDSAEFRQGFGVQVYQRSLSEALIVQVKPDGSLSRLALVNPDDREELNRVITPAMIARLKAGAPSVIVRSADRIGVVTPLDMRDATYVYASRVFDPQLDQQLKRGEKILADYRSLLERSRALQLRFNIALLVLSLIIVGIAVWVALEVADKLVRPVGDLVNAARRVADGDLSARVTPPKTNDEIGTLAVAFNAMTGRLQAQTGALVAANDQLDSRRALIEAVMSGVTAGVISINEDRTIRLINSSAWGLLGVGAQSPVGQSLLEISPELDALLSADTREAVVQITTAGDTKTLAVKIARGDAGPILTFDDITQQLLDQRRAAWSDVARRIAHEIKNPLTPIQLAAERLQRRYGKHIDAADGTFTRLTETIVRQVGDLRRMVDEFSSFARMPKPLFREESLLDIARQVLFLHEVAHSNICFTLEHDDALPPLVCDRRQLGQALTNIVKNAVEAIDARGEGTTGDIAVALRCGTSASGGAVRHLIVTIADTGVGLPVERDRIVEPYMTTRSRGTGLGLAIVKKIVEEHFGTINFTDRQGGGTLVTICFDAGQLESVADDSKLAGVHYDENMEESGPTTLTRQWNN
jgi:two-component system nitrogen regulation sensor histidine kinase NtrY